MTNQRNYFKIYDDEGIKSYFKTNLTYEEIEALKKDFEENHQEFYNNDFIKFIKENDPSAEEIEVHAIYY
ncbi:MAG: hypothetical protein IPJ75_13800 [Ignavibacteriales bacterium]|nr:hypothetical protein [Ignavibacteriales bacterium]